jgi:hypothetical protein
VEQDQDQKESRARANEADIRDTARLERLINRRLVKVSQDEDKILQLQMRVQRYRQEIRRLSVRRAEKLTMRLL